MENKIMVKAIIKGRVQGVYYRAHTREAARGYGLAGYVKNLADGSVEAVFQGSREQIDKIIDWCRTGSPGSTVTDVIVETVTDQKDFAGFDIRY